MGKQEIEATNRTETKHRREDSNRLCQTQIMDQASKQGLGDRSTYTCVAPWSDKIPKIMRKELERHASARSTATFTAQPSMYSTCGEAVTKTPTLTHGEALSRRKTPGKSSHFDPHVGCGLSPDTRVVT